MIFGPGFRVVVCPHFPASWQIVLMPPDYVCPDCLADVVAEAEAATSGEQS